MTHKDVIESINFKIENSNFERFDLSQVVNELNNTYRDIAAKTDIFETKGHIFLVKDVFEYEMPTGMTRGTRAIFRGQQLDFVSQEAMDRNISSWETHKADTPALECIVYNNHGATKLRPYPMVNWEAIQPEGDLVYLGQLSDASMDVQYYAWMRASDGAKYFSAAYGTVSDIDLREVLTVYGTYLPARLTEATLGNEMQDLEEVYVNALIYGTAGNLLFTSGRTEDAQKAQSFMRLYGVSETDMSAIKQKDFSGGFRNTARNTEYRTPFNR